MDVEGWQQGDDLPPGVARGGEPVQKHDRRLLGTHGLSLTPREHAKPTPDKSTPRGIERRGVEGYS
jgi:hypothetical protein